MRIALIEDVPALADKIRQALHTEKFGIDCFASHDDAAQALLAHPYDLIIADLCLPDNSAARLLRDLPANNENTPVLVLSMPDAAGKRIDALNHGASDHIIKPFEPAELVARVRALLRRQTHRAPAADANNHLHLDPIRHAVRVKGTEVSVSAKEFQLLQALSHPPGVVVSRAELEDRLYGWQGEVNSNSVEVHIHNLRKKLGAGVIQTVRGVGYKITR